MRAFFNELKQLLSSYFVFTSGERRATLLLIAVIIVLSASIVIINIWPGQPADFSDFENALASLNAFDTKSSAKNSESPSVDPVWQKKQTTTKDSLFEFDPNNLPENDWLRLGFSSKQVESIKKYEKAGGHFYKKEDVKKLYVVSEQKYLQLEPYIVIRLRNDSSNDIKKPSQTVSFEKHIVSRKPLDLNTATATQLEELKGIGEWIAKNIISYREKLGGYNTTSQLLEVKYITDSVFAIIEPQVIVNTVYINQFNINSDNLLGIRHPYLDYQTKKLLSAYRKMHGDFVSFEEIENLNIIEPLVLKKLKPYIKFTE